MERIRCGVIGLGWFGEHHVDVLQQLPMEFMAETQKLIGISLEGSVG